MTSVDLEAHFEALHRASEDPWALATSWYERRKRAIALALLPEERFVRAFEPACSIGVLTEALADRCASVVATDGSAAAIERAQARLAGRDNVELAWQRIPGDWPAGAFDLIVLSEIGYYLEADTLDEVAERTVTSLADGGTLLAVHWRHRADDFRLDGGDEVHARIAAHPRLSRVAGYLDADVRIELFGRDR